MIISWIGPGDTDCLSEIGSVEGEPTITTVFCNADLRAVVLGIDEGGEEPATMAMVRMTVVEWEALKTRIDTKIAEHTKAIERKRISP